MTAINPADVLCAARIPADVAARIGQDPATTCAQEADHDALEHDDCHGLSWLGEPLPPRFRPLPPQEALLVGVECVLLDHAAELSGPEVDANLADLAYRYLAVAGEDAAPEIRDALEVGDVAEGAADACRPVTVEIEGEQITTRVRGGEEMSEEGKAAFAEIVKAVRRRMEAERAARDPADYPLDAVLDGDLIHKAKRMGVTGTRVTALCGLNSRHVPGRDGGLRCPECAELERHYAARAANATGD